MKYPVLYKRGTEDFDNNGLGVLIDAYDVIVKEVLNGLFTLDMKYPYTSKLGNQIKTGDIIKVNASNKLKNQKFRILSVTQENNLTLTIHAFHKTFDTTTDYVRGPLDIKHQSCEYALNMLFNKSYKSKNYVGYSDIVNKQDFKCNGKQLASAIIGSEGSLIDTFGNGAQIERDNSTVDKISILQRRGHDTNILISYGKNMTGYRCIEDEQALCTVLIPYAIDNQTQEKIIGDDILAPNYKDFDGELYILDYDVSERVPQDTDITKSLLTKLGTDYMNESKCYIPKLTYVIDFVKLSEYGYPKEYNLEKLQSIDIGDTVIVYHRQYKIRTQARVTEIEYDPISESYTKLVLGDVRATYESLGPGGVIVGPPGKDGQDGLDGKPGLPGADGKTYYTWIRYADDEHGNGMANLPYNKAYIGLAYNKETKTESNNPKDYTWSKYVGDQGIPGAPGEDGVTQYTWLKYADDEHGNGMSDLPHGKTYLGLAYNKPVQQESTNPSDYKWTKIKGDQGVPGAPGEDGKTYYTWIKYADTPTSGMSDDPTGKAYLGIAYNKETQQESTNYADYTWCKIKGDDGKPGADGNIGDFPDTLPDVPKLSGVTRGMSTITLSWTYESKVYYEYEIYASQDPDFQPTAFDLLYRGKASSYTYNVNPDETWYYYARAVNSYGRATAFSSKVTITTHKIPDGYTYFEKGAIGDAIIDTLDLGRGWVGKLTADHLAVKGFFDVVDGNGKSTFNIDSFGRIYANFTSMQLNSQDVASVPYVSTEINNVKVGGRNYLRNSNFKDGIKFHTIMNYNGSGDITFVNFDNKTCCKFENVGHYSTSKYLKVAPTPYNANNGYIIGLDIYATNQCKLLIGLTGPLNSENREIPIIVVNKWVRYYIKIPPHAGNNTSGEVQFLITAEKGNAFSGYITDIMVEHGTKESDYQQAYEDLDTKVDAMATQVKSFEEQITPDALKRTFSQEFYTKDSANAEFTSKTEFEQNSKEFLLKIEQTGKQQLIPNGALREGTKFWSAWQAQKIVEMFGGFKWFTITPQYELGTQSFGIMFPEIEVQAGKTYTVGAWVSGDIQTLNYNYLMQLKNGAMEGVQRLDTISVGNVSTNAKRVSVTFVSLVTGFVQIMFGYEGVMSKDLKLRASEACCFEGNFLYPYQEAFNAIYASNAYFDITGMGMKHDDGSISRITSKSFELTDVYERLKMAMKKGTIYAYDAENGHFLGMFGSNKLNNTYRGVTTGISGSSHYYAIGASKALADSDVLDMTPYILIAQQDLQNVFGNSYISGGVNFMNTPCIFHKSALFKSSPRFEGGITFVKNTGQIMNMYCADNSLYVEANLRLPTGGSFFGGGLYGGNITTLGYMRNGSYEDVIKLYASIQQIDFLRPLNMNHFGIYNATIASSAMNFNTQPTKSMSLMALYPQPEPNVIDEIQVKDIVASSVENETTILDTSNVQERHKIMIDDNNVDMGKLEIELLKDYKETKTKLKIAEGKITELERKYDELLKIVNNLTK